MGGRSLKHALANVTLKRQTRLTLTERLGVEQIIAQCMAKPRSGKIGTDSRTSQGRDNR